MSANEPQCYSVDRSRACAGVRLRLFDARRVGRDLTACPTIAVTVTNAVGNAGGGAQRRLTLRWLDGDRTSVHLAHPGTTSVPQLGTQFVIHASGSSGPLDVFPVYGCTSSPVDLSGYSGTCPPTVSVVFHSWIVYEGSGEFKQPVGSTCGLDVSPVGWLDVSM